MRFVVNQLNCGRDVHSLDAVHIKDLFVTVLDVIHRGCGAHQADLHLEVCQLALVLDILSNSLKDGKQLLAAQRHTKGSVSVQKTQIAVDRCQRTTQLLPDWAATSDALCCCQCKCT